MKKLFLIMLGSLILFNGRDTFASEKTLNFTKDDRVLVVAAHPDDETLGAAGAIQRAVQSGAAVKVLYLTHGDQNELASIFYQKKPLLRKEDFLKSGQIRKSESVRAMAELGVREQDLIFLGYPDFGTLAIWKKHWDATRPYRSLLTRMNRVLYKEDFSYGNYYKGENITADFEKVLKDFKPTKIFVTAPFDLNSDHQAAFLFLQTALFNLEKESARPEVYAYLVHYHKWPKPRSLNTELPLDIPPLMDSDKEKEWVKFNLSSAEIEKKKTALFEYKSQMAYSKNFLLSFARKNELFYLSEPLPVKKEDRFPTNSYFEQGDAEPGNIVFKAFQGEFWIDIRLTDPWDRMGVLNLDVYGYSHDEDFAKMPKISLRLFGNKLMVNKGVFRLSNAGILYTAKGNRILIRLPLKILDNPDRVFVSALTAREELSLDFGSWRLLQLD